MDPPDCQAVEHRVIESQPDDMTVGYVYVVRHITTGIILYVGSCIDCAQRIQTHQRTHSCGYKTALQRYTEDSGGWANFELHPIRVVTYDSRRLPLTLKREEDEMIELYRELGHELLNKRRACDSKEDRREYMRQWRIRNGQGGDDESYMARKSREFRERHHEMAIQG
jgi:uncharacterized protein (DUF2235 family)